MLVNGAEVSRSNDAGSYVDVDRLWKSGDRVELRLDMTVGTEHSPVSPEVLAFTYGPLVLAGALGREGLRPGSDIVINERRYGDYNNTPIKVPTLVGAPAAIAAQVRAGSRPLEFSINSNEQQPVQLIPYHRIAHQRYATYWRVDQPVA